MEDGAFNHVTRLESTCTFNGGSREAAKVRVWCPKFDPPHLIPFSHLSEDAQVVMKAILEESERKAQFILSQALPKQNDSISYYNSVYRGSFNADIPSTGMLPPARYHPQASTESTTVAATDSPSLFSEMFTHQEAQDLEPLSHGLETVANSTVISQPDDTLSPSSNDFSLSPLDSSGEVQAVFDNYVSNVDVRLDTERQEILKILTPPITTHSVNQTIKICLNEDSCSTEGRPFINDRICDEQGSLNESAGPELSPLQCDQLLISKTEDNNSIKMLPREQMKRKFDRTQSLIMREITADDKPIRNKINNGVCPAKQPRLCTPASASTQDNDLDLIENMLSVSQDNDKMPKCRRKFKAPFKSPASTSMPFSATSKDQREPPTCSKEMSSNTDFFSVDENRRMKCFNVVNAGFISKEDRTAVSISVLQSEEAIMTLVFKDGSTLFSSNSNNDKAVGVAVGYYNTACRQGPLTREEDENRRLICLYIPSCGIKANIDFYQWAKDLIQELMSSKVRKVTFMAKEVLLFLLDVFDFEFSVVSSWIILDVKVASWLLDPDNPVQNFEGLPDTTSRNEGDMQDKDFTQRTLMSNLRCLGSIMLQLFHKLKARSLWPLFFNLETPLIPLLAKMEKTRMKVDVDMFMKFSAVLKSKLSMLEKKAHNLAGHSFCINSHPQLRQVIFEELRLDLISKKKKKVSVTSVNHVKSTSEAILKQLSATHPLPAVVLEYRQLQKLKSTYVDGLMGCVEKGYLQTHWDQTAAATGRLTSYQPNLQSVPKQPVSIKDYKTSYIVGKDDDSSLQVFARDPFISEKGMSFLAADFQQIELRLLAHLSDDPRLIGVFTKAKTEDIFLELTSQWLGHPVDDVTEAEREQTKRVVYSVMYGAGKEKLAEYLKIEPSHAKAIMTSFLDKIPAINSFTKMCIDFCQSHGYTCTIFKRRRLIPNITSKSPKLKAQAERQAVNFCIQGSAADICKAAMLQVERALLSRPHIQARLLLQIHDELLYEVPDDNLDEFSELLKLVMESADHLCGEMVHLKVPLSVSLSRGKQWGHLETIHKQTDTAL